MKELQLKVEKYGIVIDNFNIILQEYFNPPSEFKNEMKLGSVIYREGDKILQLKNQNEDDVYNGDIGTLISVDKIDGGYKLTVDFDDNYVEYTNGDFINISHAYCVSVHKSQGSEYPAVVIPLLQGPRQLYNRNLLYTAVTRARKCVTLVGSDTVFQEMIENTNEQNRNSSLDERIKEFC